LKKRTLVTTVMSNVGWIAPSREPVEEWSGPRSGSLCGGRDGSGELQPGGEQSGHTVFLDHNTTCDGILTALQLLSILRRKEQNLDELTGGIELLPQVLYNVEVREKKNLSEVREIKREIARIEESLVAPEGCWSLFGTEPLLRIMIEGKMKGGSTSLPMSCGIGGKTYRQDRKSPLTGCCKTPICGVALILRH